MRLPAQLSRRKKDAFKNDFGHILILAGSRNFLGAAALSGLAAMRSGAGLVTLGIPASLNCVLQQKISPVLMTLPLDETVKQSLSVSAFRKIKEFPSDLILIGPGLSTEESTRHLVLKILSSLDKPLVIDADALNCVATDLRVLKKRKGLKILTPHPGEMARLTRLNKNFILQRRQEITKQFAADYHSIVLLKGHQTIVASAEKQIYINKTGNPGMATAGSGDVLSGIIAAFLAQGLNGFEAAKWACYLHGKAGDLAAKKKTPMGMIATDIIENIPEAIRRSK